MPRHRMRTRRQRADAMSTPAESRQLSRLARHMGSRKDAARALYTAYRDATLQAYWTRELWWKPQQDGTRRIDA